MPWTVCLCGVLAIMAQGTWVQILGAYIVQCATETAKHSTMCAMNSNRGQVWEGLPTCDSVCGLPIAAVVFHFSQASFVQGPASAGCVFVPSAFRTLSPLAQSLQEDSHLCRVSHPVGGVCLLDLQHRRN